MPQVSVIIPCYNQGMFLSEAVDSALSQTFADLEIIIVNDGSNDPGTVEQCNSYEDQRIRVLNTANQGLAAARNNGIAHASGNYILPLDADDKIAPQYISEAVEVLESDGQIGIVYCKARLFDAVEGDWHLPEYTLEEMLRDNVIFCTALFRKRDWQDVGGYDTGMVFGWEDYDFWLSLIERGLKVHCLDGRYFFYRVAPGSMVRSREKSQKIEMFKRIYHRHQNLFAEHIEAWLEPLLELREPYLTSRLYVDCGEGLSDGSSVPRKIEMGRRTFRFGIDSFEGRQALRFDPADDSICIELEAIELVGGAGKLSLDLNELQANADVREGNRFMFSSLDPQIFLSIDRENLTKITEVVITCDVIAWGAEALRQIIDYQKLQLKNKSQPFSLSKWFRANS